MIPGRRSAWIQTPADTGVVNGTFLLWAWTPLFLVGYVLLAIGNRLLILATLQRKRQALRAGVTP